MDKHALINLFWNKMTRSTWYVTKRIEKLNKVSNCIPHFEVERWFCCRKVSTIHWPFYAYRLYIHLLFNQFSPYLTIRKRRIFVIALLSVFESYFIVQAMDWRLQVNDLDADTEGCSKWSSRFTWSRRSVNLTVQTISCNGHFHVSSCTSRVLVVMMLNMLYAAVHLKCPCMDLHTMVVGYFDMLDVECKVFYQVTFVCGLCSLFASWARSAILASQAMFVCL